MQVSIKPINTPNVNKTAVYQNFLTNCGKISFQSDRLESSPNKDCFIKSTENIEPKTRVESENPLDENARLKALHNIETPITTKEEYREVIRRIKNSKTMLGKQYFNFDTKGKYSYERAKEDELGLLPYVGSCDRSDEINRFLSGRMRHLDEKKENLSDGTRLSRWEASFEPESYSVMEDLVRALDYSLGKLDEKYGKYEGIVYRHGYMDTGCGQFFSTTLDPIIGAKKGSPEYSVIRAKNGHKIVDFQKAIKSVFAEQESEILLDRKSKFKLLKDEECDEELLRAKITLAENLFGGKAKEVMDGKRYKVEGYTREQLLNLIEVYEEI